MDLDWSSHGRLARLYAQAGPHSPKDYGDFAPVVERLSAS